MKKTRLVALGLGALSLAGLVGAGVGLSANNSVRADEVKADEPVKSGVISVDLTGEEWATPADSKEQQYIAVRFWDDGAAHIGWSDFELVDKDVYISFVSYSLTFVPTKMHIMRFNPVHSPEECKDHAYDNGYNWGNTQDLAFSDNAHVVIYGSYGKETKTGHYAYIKGKSAETGWDDWKDLGILSRVRLNQDNHVEYYNDITFTGYAEFLVYMFESNSYGRTSATVSTPDDGYNWTWPSDNIKNDQAAAVTVRVTLDRNEEHIYFETPSTANLDDANEWGASFYKNATSCAATMEEWSSFEKSFNLLSGDVKNIFTSAAASSYGPKEEADTNWGKALHRYDEILRKYGTGTYNDFMGRKSVLGLSAKLSTNIRENTEISNSVIVITAVGGTAVAASAGFFLLRRRTL